MKFFKNLEIKKCLHGKTENNEEVNGLYGNVVHKTFM